MITAIKNYLNTSTLHHVFALEWKVENVSISANWKDRFPKTLLVCLAGSIWGGACHCGKCFKHSCIRWTRRSHLLGSFKKSDHKRIGLPQLPRTKWHNSWEGWFTAPPSLSPVFREKSPSPEKKWSICLASFTLLPFCSPLTSPHHHHHPPSPPCKLIVFILIFSLEELKDLSDKPEIMETFLTKLESVS